MQTRSGAYLQGGGDEPNLMKRFIGRYTASIELFFNIVTSGIETFVIPWDQLLYPVS